MPPQSPDFDIDAAVANLPSDFSSDSEYGNFYAHPPRAVAPASTQGFRQTTLFGTQAPGIAPSPTQANRKRQYIADLPSEAPTHHALDLEALKTWVYPTNIGSIRDYQYSIVRNGLFNNTLVALPTGLGKTFIAATVMLNFYRWTKDAQIVFMAPTKPLVAQQVDACFNICGIPRSVTTMLTGEISPALRSEEWATKRVFFMTPQTLDNDLKTGIGDPKKIVLLVVDEAHRATGNYAYVKVIEFLRRFNKSFRVLALTATPGSSVETVQEVIDNLEISQIEIRTEESFDIKQYVHKTNIEQVILEPEGDLVEIQDLIAKTLQPLVNKLAGLIGNNGHVNRDPLALTSYGMLQAQGAWNQSGAARTANQGLKSMIRALFSILAQFGHAIKLLIFHGMRPFFENMKEWRAEGEAKRSKVGKYQGQILADENFTKMMDKLQTWVRKDDFISHPKVSCLVTTILNHFMDAGDGLSSTPGSRSQTRIIVFCEYRGSAEDIARTLNRHGPMIRASVFVGQQNAKNSEGMTQKEQISTIEKFKDGTFNVIVATSIGEEGLDIGQVDLIVCYDGSSSPIRMLQRMGRTGRKRAGQVVLLLMKGKEENSFQKANDNYEKMQKMISKGDRFSFRHDLSVRIVPRDIKPEVDKRIVEIPVENTQDPSLPEPRRRPKKTTKMPKKRFNMPDDVETGFQSLSKLFGNHGKKQREKTPEPINPELLEENLRVRPPLKGVLLDELESSLLQDRYQTLVGNADEELEVSLPELTNHPEYQRFDRPFSEIRHGVAAKRMVRMLQAMHGVTENTVSGWEFVLSTSGPLPRPPECPDSEDEDHQPLSQKESFGQPSTLDLRDEEDEPSFSAPPRRKTNTRPTARRQTRPKPPRRGTSISLESEDSDDGEQEEEDEEPDSEFGGFVVPDDAPTLTFYPSSRRHSPTASGATQSNKRRREPDLFASQTPTGRINGRTQEGRKEVPPAPLKFFVPTTFMATQDTEDEELPDIGALVARGAKENESMVKNKRMASAATVRVESSDEEVFSPSKRRSTLMGKGNKGRRQVEKVSVRVESSEEDEEDEFTPVRTEPVVFEIVTSDEEEEREMATKRRRPKVGDSSNEEDGEVETRPKRRRRAVMSDSDEE